MMIIIVSFRMHKRQINCFVACKSLARREKVISAVEQTMSRSGYKPKCTWHCTQPINRDGCRWTAKKAEKKQKNKRTKCVCPSAGSVIKYNNNNNIAIPVSRYSSPFSHTHAARSRITSTISILKTINRKVQCICSGTVRPVASCAKRRLARLFAIVYCIRHTHTQADTQTSITY